MAIPHDMILWCLLIMAGQVPGTSRSPDGAAEESVARMAHMKRVAKNYQITFESDAAKKLVLIDDPLLRFDDQVIGVVDGALFLWMLDDKPAAAASIWIRDSTGEYHEFQSLAPDALVASNQGEVKWAPALPGIERKLASNANPPAASSAGRLIQMRAMAREYSGTVVSSPKEREEIRLLPQPVFRYGRPDGVVIDGAIFAFCVGTNPEILLLVEAVTKDKKLQWNYGFARMTSRGCEVRRDDHVVWTAPADPINSPTEPYFTVIGAYNGPGSKIGP